MSDRPSDVRLELRDVVLAVKEVIEWYDLGLQLGLPDSTLASIATHHEVDGHKRMMLSKWLQFDTEASWEKLAAALDAINKRVIAANIRRQFLKIVLDKQIQTEEDKAAAEERQAVTEKALESTKSSFSNLVVEVRSSMEKNNTRVMDVRQFLVTYFEGECYIPEGGDLTKIFDCVTVAKLWRYDHYGPLEQLVKKYLPEADTARALMREYVNQLTAFHATTKIIDLIPTMSLPDSEEDDQVFSPKKYNRFYRKLKVKLSLSKKVSEMTLDYIHKLWEALRIEFDLPSLTAIIDNIVEGSLSITWLVLPHIAEKIKCKVFKSFEFLGHHGIVSIELYGSLTLYDDKWMEGSTALYRACFSGDREAVNTLLEDGANVNRQNDNDTGQTSLIGASRNGHVHIVKKLLSRSAKVDEQDKELGRSALMVASLYGHTEVAEVLLEHGVLVDLQGKDGMTALMLASWFGFTNIVGMLLDHGAAIDHCEPDEDGLSALMCASVCGHVEVVKLLLLRGARVDLTNENGSTALTMVSIFGHSSTARVLIDHGAVVDHKMKGGMTPLHLASYAGRPETVELLLNHGANIDLPTDNGSSALMCASVGDCVEVMKFLLERGARAELTSEYGYTALTIASEYGLSSTARVLIHHGVVVDHKDKDGWTPLHWASHEGHPETVELLLDHGANIDLPTDDEYGSTALSWACYKGHADVAKLLLERGAFVDFQDKNGRSPLMKACLGGHLQTVKLLMLLKHKTQLNLQDQDGQTALFFAAKEGDVQIVKTLLGHGASIEIRNNDGYTAFDVAEGEAVRQVLEEHYEQMVMLLVTQLQESAGYQVQLPETNTEPTEVPQESEKKRESRSFRKQVWDPLKRKLLPELVRKERASQRGREKKTRNIMDQSVESKSRMDLLGPLGRISRRERHFF